MKALPSYLIVFTILVLSSCDSLELPETAYDATNIPDQMNTWMVDSQFKYNTSEEVNFSINVVDNTQNSLPKVPLKVYAMDDLEAEARYLSSGMSDDNGQLVSDYKLDKNTKYLMIEINYPGFVSPQIVEITSNNLRYTIDPNVEPLSTGFVEETELPGKNRGAKSASINYTYLSTYNNSGVPDNLMANNDVINQDILDLLAASFPEGQPVPTYNPQYITSGNSASLIVEELAEVWITFIHEGAGYRNAVGYYTYPTNNPPKTTADITDFQIIFPNTSFQGSGGGLVTGNKVYLGDFEAGTTVGWFLVPNGWNGSAVEERSNQDTKYSNSNLNTFTDLANQSHCVILDDEDDQKLYLGFEDISRPGGDKDFNDALFMVTATPYENIVTDDLAKTRSNIGDTDGDGAPDNSDDFIDDPDIAFVSSIPGEGVYGTLAFEDRWPSTGDYDMNDLVVSYNVQEFRNSSNLVIKSRARFILRAMGAGLKNGFGFETNLSPSQIASVDGSVLTENIISVASNGVENGQDKAVIVVFDNGYKVFNRTSGFVNTEDELNHVQPDTITIDITYSSPIPAGSIGSAPYNAFIFTGLRRGYEVHLPDNPPTSLADLSLFQTLQDDSDPNLGRYYKSSNNLPWAMNFNTDFVYPKETEGLQDGYNYFFDWVISSGGEYPDWYYDKVGYRNLQHLYNK